MKVTELRVGNKAKRGGIVVTIDARSIFDIWESSPEYEPLPLSNENQLIEYGFNTDYQKGYIGIDVNNTDFVLTRPGVMGEWQKHFAYQWTSGGIAMYKELPFFHELQNFFFAMTGKDLKEKEFTFPTDLDKLK